MQLLYPSQYLQLIKGRDVTGNVISRGPTLINLKVLNLQKYEFIKGLWEKKMKKK